MSPGEHPHRPDQEQGVTLSEVFGQSLTPLARVVLDGNRVVLENITDGLLEVTGFAVADDGGRRHFETEVAVREAVDLLVVAGRGEVRLIVEGSPFCRVDAGNDAGDDAVICGTVIGPEGVLGPFERHLQAEKRCTLLQVHADRLGPPSAARFYPD